MAWTDERVELLKKLWSEGLSASQIANRLGGVSRNAVIGKVHRLGLSGRATTSRIKSVRSRKRAASVGVRSSRLKYASHGNAALKQQFGSSGLENPTPHVSSIEELVIPLNERASIMSLTADMCRWPIGDPTEKDFHFCGRDKVAGIPYCEHHARVAFQPLQSRRKSKAAAKS
ncbi:MAG: GcrA family cell cycle regulator [Methyloligellaceae bacterium]